MDNDPKPKPDQNSSQKAERYTGLSAFWAELKRRKVMRVAITYIVASIAIIEFASVTFEGFGIPIWAFRFVMLMVFMGFPIAIILAWAFELTPDGIKTTKKAQEETEKTEAHSKKRNWLAYAVGALFPTIIFGALALFFYIRSGGDAQAADTEKSIAVLPLTNMSPDPENAFFADGVQEDILTNLSKIEELQVIARTSTQQYRDTIKTVETIGEELGVNYLVEGSVRRAGNRVKVTVQLIDCGSGDHIWANDYDRSLDDIFAIQAEVAKEIAGQLQAALSPDTIAEIERRPTDNQEAYDYYVLARLSQEGVSGGVPRSERIAILEKAVDLDPNFAEAWALLTWQSISYWSNTLNHKDPVLLAKARHAMNEARRLGPGLPHTHHAQSNIIYHEQENVEGRIPPLLEALAIDPNFFLAQRSLGGAYLSLGRLDEAEYYNEAATRTDPFSPRANVSLLSVYVVRRMWEKARTLIQDNLDRKDREAIWRRLSAQIEYLQSGGRQAFTDAMGRIPGFSENPIEKTRKAVAERNFSRALEVLKELDPDREFQLISFPSISNYNMSISSIDLLAALIWFELGEEEKWKIETEKAEPYLGGNVEGVSITHVKDWSYLAICYALTGERDLMDMTIAKVREKTSTVNWKYRQAVVCEMRIAICYLVLGDHDKAIETLEAASKMDSPLFLAQLEPDERG